MIRRWLLLLLLLMLFIPPAHAEYWDASEGRLLNCCDDRPGCQVLQTVMLGSFAAFDPADRVDVRIFSAALPRLCDVTEEDFAHFQQSFRVDENTLMLNYYTALGNCLWADIIISPTVHDTDEQNARTVLHLFLSSDGDTNAAAQQEIIRMNATSETIAVIANKARGPWKFVEYVLLGR